MAGISDRFVSQSAAKQAVNAISLTNITLSGSSAADGYTPSDGSRILVNGQSSQQENGIYVVNTGGAWERAPDASSTADFVPGFMVYVSEGNYEFSSIWTFNEPPNSGFILGVHSITFSKRTRFNYRQDITLNSTDITNQYVDLFTPAVDESIAFFVRGKGLREFGQDYSTSIVGGVTRLTFENDLATSGTDELVDGDVLQITYLY